MNKPGIKQRKRRQWRLRQHVNGWVKIGVTTTATPPPKPNASAKTYFTISIER